MNSNSSGRIDDIEALRAVAILITIFGHLQYLFSENAMLHTADMYFGLWSGVDLFFAISGFVISRDLLSRLDKAKDSETFWRASFAFWIRRIYRIWPTSWLWITVFAVGALIFREPHYFGYFSRALSDFSAVAMQVANFHFWSCMNSAIPNQCGSANVWWSLSLEEQFYIFLPLAALLFRKKLPYALGAIVLVQIFIPRPIWSLLWSIRTDAICLGVLLAIFSRHPIYQIVEPKFMAKSFYAISVVAILIFLLIDLPSDWAGKINPVPFSTGLVAIVSVALVLIASYNKGYIVRNQYVKAVLMWIGSRSYALYLIHYPAIPMTLIICRYIEPSGTAFEPSDTLRYFVVWLCLLLGLSELNYRFVETPLRRKGRQIALRMEMGSGAISPLTEDAPQAALFMSERASAPEGRQ